MTQASYSAVHFCVSVGGSADVCITARAHATGTRVGTSGGGGLCGCSVPN